VLIDQLVLVDRCRMPRCFLKSLVNRLAMPSHVPESTCGRRTNWTKTRVVHPTTEGTRHTPPSYKQLRKLPTQAPAPAALVAPGIAAGAAVLTAASCGFAAHKAGKAAEAADKAATAQTSNVALAVNKDEREAAEHVWKRNEETRKQADAERLGEDHVWRRNEEARKQADAERQRVAHEIALKRQEAEWAEEQERKRCEAVRVQQAHEADERRKQEQHVRDMSERDMRLKENVVEPKARPTSGSAPPDGRMQTIDFSPLMMMPYVDDAEDISREDAAALREEGVDAEHARLTGRALVRASDISDSAYESQDSSPAGLRQRTISGRGKSTGSETKSENDRQRSNATMADADEVGQRFARLRSPNAVLNDRRCDHSERTGVTPPVIENSVDGSEPGDIEHQHDMLEDRAVVIDVATPEPIYLDPVQPPRPDSPVLNLGSEGELNWIPMTELARNEQVITSGDCTGPTSESNSESASLKDWLKDVESWDGALCKI